MGEISLVERAVDTSPPIRPYYDHAGITIYHGDCREILLGLPKVDLVLTDPPYGIEFQSNHRQEKHLRMPDCAWLEARSALSRLEAL